MRENNHFFEWPGSEAQYIYHFRRKFQILFENFTMLHVQIKTFEKSGRNNVKKHINALLGLVYI